MVFRLPGDEPSLFSFVDASRSPRTFAADKHGDAESPTPLNLRTRTTALIEDKPKSKLD